MSVNSSNMKINCDVCNKDEASMFCPADDAALCSACDHQVHHANNLSGKHPRFLLLPLKIPPSVTSVRGCDVAIHKVNEHTMNHCRFILTGVKLSPVALSSITGNGVVSDIKPKSRDQEPIAVKKPVAVFAPVVNQTQKITTLAFPKSNGSGHGSTASNAGEF
ncbi:hypothetical protein L1987_66589 [Smallanthus sonchifolius]|uniref:Uncharacterized protein n=1 Tax=Smallanthus sonchifolius TaxID=185202 RepID=A0ACB9BXW1_9ASTR|nr:hypothetical protein L1987_66589 [Smallanthus sonchifolius]